MSAKCLTCGTPIQARPTFSTLSNSWVAVGSCPTCKCIRTEGVGLALTEEV